MQFSKIKSLYEKEIKKKYDANPNLYATKECEAQDENNRKL